MTNIINKFSKKVDLRNREEMVKFLTSHFRYDTMNSWNNATSYANNVKLYNLGLTEEQLSKAYEMLESNELYDLAFEPCIVMWNRQHNYEWQVGFNGRSGGYLVLYTGGQKDSGFKSQCTECGQLNYKTVEETGCTCGKCGKNARKNLDHPIMQSYSYPGKGVDMNEDFKDWDISEIRERVKIVQEFDALCDELLANLIYYCDNASVEEEEYYVPQKRKTIVIND